MAEAGSDRALPRLAALALVLAALGLPINQLPAYTLLAIVALLIFTGRVSCQPLRWLAALALTALVLAQHLFLAVPRIEEGHNVFLIDGPGSALERGLPADVFAAMAQRFDIAYPAERRCRAGAPLCWRPDGIPDRVFAFAADGVLGGHEFTRRVAGIDFRSAIRLRLGIVNDGALNFVGRDGDVERLWRDRRSLAIFGRWQNRLPFFLMYRFPPAFAGSTLCWRGDVMWEGADGRFAQLTHPASECRTVRSEDIGRRIFAFAIAPDDTLAMSLDANARIRLWRALDAATAAIGVIGIVLLLVRVAPRRLRLPLLMTLPALAVIVLNDATFVGGYRTLDGGDDGLIFSGFARRILWHLAHGDLPGALQGGENVFYFTPGMRYVRALEYLIFGDSFLGYLAVMLLAPLVVYAVLARFLGPRWALAAALAFVLTPLGMLFGTSYLHYAVWSARGFADPLAATAFLTALLCLAGPHGAAFDTRAAPAFWGALMMALAVIVRPNLVPGAAVLLAGVGLAALWQTQGRRLAALCAGFAPVLLLPWHNWYFGGRFVPIGDNATAANIWMVPPAVWWQAASDILRLDLASESLARAASHAALFLSGPSGSWLMIPPHVLAFALAIRVAAAPRFEPMLRLCALAALALSLLGYVYVAALRYHLVMWMLLTITVLAWLRIEGRGLIARVRPDFRARIAAAWPVRALARLQGFVSAA
jgi:hypothetical protein